MLPGYFDSAKYKIFRKFLFLKIGNEKSGKKRGLIEATNFRIFLRALKNAASLNLGTQ